MKPYNSIIKRFFILTVLIAFSTVSVEIYAQGSPQIKIDNNIVPAGPSSGLKLPSWLKAGQKLAADQDVHSISVVAFSVNGISLEFSDVLSITAEQTVPAGKVWKLESVLFEQAALNESYWNLFGNSNTSAANDFIGTANSQALSLKANNTDVMYLSATGNVGVGNASPTAKLEVSGQMKITGGDPGNNKVLVSDASGLGSWKDFASANVPTGAGTLNYVAKWTPSGNALGSSAIFDNAAGVGIGTAAPNASLLLDMTSTTKGFAMPRMTTSQRFAIASPIDGLQVYDTDLKDYYYFNGTKWDCVAMPSGTVAYFATNVAPEGYLECAGQAVSRTQYPDLFATIGTAYGAGNGATTFNLPDLRSEFIRGTDNGRGVDAGRTTGTFQAQDWKGFNMTNTGQNTNSYSHGPVYMGKSTSAFTGNLFTGQWRANAAAIGAMWDGSEIRPRNVAMLPCIKY
jgi:microcystin-dependent protein